VNDAYPDPTCAAVLAKSGAAGHNGYRFSADNVIPSPTTFDGMAEGNSMRNAGLRLEFQALLLAPALVALVLLVACASTPDGRPQTPAEVRAGQHGIERKLEKLRRRGPKTPDAPAEAARAFVEQRLPLGEDKLPLVRLKRELAQLRRREAQLAGNDGEPPGGITSWDWLGPGNVGGRTRALVIDPTDPDRMFAAGVAGGIWKTTDGGDSWNPADDLLLNLAVCSLAMDPNDPDTLYAGTGEGIYVNAVFVQGLGIFKSIDGGTSWTQLPGTTSGAPAGAFDYVNKVVISPNNPNTVYAGTRSGVWRSVNAGTTWSLMLGNPQHLSAPTYNSNGSLVGCTDLVIRSDTFPDMLFAAFGNATADGLFRTFDGGATWQTYTVPANQGRTTIALAPSNESTMYLLMADNGSGGAFGQLLNVFRSDDGGDSFTAQVDFGTLIGPHLLSNLILATGCIPDTSTYSQGWYDNIIAVDPIDPNTVWVGGVDMFRSDDGGVSWGIPAYWIFYTFDPPPPYQLHPDHHLIVFHPDYDGAGNQTMFVTNDGGIFKTENARAATSQEDCPIPGDEPLPEIVWERLNNGYGVTQFYHGDSARDRDMFVAGAQDNGTIRVEAADTPEAWELIQGGDGSYVAIDPRDSQVVFTSYQEFPNIWKSIDGGQTLVEAVDGITDTDGLFFAPYAMDESNPDVLWTGGRRPWRTQDSAGVWELAGPDFSGPARISAIAIAPSDSNVVYLGFENGYVVRTTDGLSASPSWEVFVNGLIGGYVTSVAVDPFDPETAYITYSNYGISHVLRTVDGGQSWNSIDGIGFAGVPDIPAHWITVRPCDPQQLYVATELGVFASDDAGATWNPVNTGLAHVVVESLDWQGPNRLVAFTHGRGAYRTTIAPSCPVIPKVKPRGALKPITVPVLPG